MVFRSFNLKSLHGPSHEFLPLESTTQSFAVIPGQRKFISPVLYLNSIIIVIINAIWAIQEMVSLILGCCKKYYADVVGT